MLKNFYRGAHQGLNGDRFMEAARRHFGFHTDRELASALGVPPPLISNIRRGRIYVGPNMLVRMYDLTGLSIDALRNWGQAEGRR